MHAGQKVHPEKLSINTHLEILACMLHARWSHLLAAPDPNSFGSSLQEIAYAARIVETGSELAKVSMEHLP
jgi:hypothetical protein